MIGTEPAAERFDRDRVEAIAARLDLRQPNKEALESIADELALHYDGQMSPGPFEGVIDIATGVGKTYVLAAAIEYLIGEGARNFAVIAPGRTILDKTVANFTPGHAKSLLGGMDARPVVVTSENFATAQMRASMDDPEQVKLFVFTVQALTKPQTKLGRKTHKFQEGLGEAFYTHLQSLDDLIVFADEHHAYYGAAFSATIRDLHPRALIGLTATPHKQTRPELIIYRYPLAAAIGERLVKTPVLVGRKDDRRDMRTKLLDGIRLLELKEQAIARWSGPLGITPVNPVMLVIAPKIDEAGEIEAVLTDPAFAEGRYADKVLTVHSAQPDDALAQLDTLELPECPYRIVISVGMLKEGWDVKNVYVIASMRASVSDILTEQTLGRGLRLPFGKYTGIEILDTLEVLGHERYEELLRKAGVLNEQFIDRRTRAAWRRNAEGQLVRVVEHVTVETTIVATDGTTPEPATDAGGDEPSMTGNRPIVRSVEDHTAKATEALTLTLQLPPRPDLPPLRVPRLTMTQVKSDFSLSDITDLWPFSRLGGRIAADPEESLRRVTVGAQIVHGSDGMRRVEMVTTTAADRVESPGALFPLHDARARLVAIVLGAPVVPSRRQEVHPAGRIVDEFIRGLGADAERILSGYMDRAAAGLVQLIVDEHRKFAARPRYDEVVSLTSLDADRVGRPVTSRDRFGEFKRGVGYEGYTRSLYAQDWFDSSTERDAANILDGDEHIVVWARLQRNDLPILWTDAREYNPDFVAVEDDGAHWLVEVKMDKEMESADVQGKREAARRWANHVSADEKVGATWQYLLVSEADVKTAHESWQALKGLGNR